MFASSTLEFSYFQRSNYLKKDELNGVGGGKGFVTRRLVRLYTGLEVGGYALLSRLLPLLDKAGFAALHSYVKLPLEVSKMLPQVYIADTLLLGLFGKAPLCVLHSIKFQPQPSASRLST